MNPETLPLIVGVPGAILTADDRTLLDAVRPAGVILFARNVLHTEQVRNLVRAIRELPWEPLVAVDLEGGLVNRFEALWGGLPSPAAAGVAGRRAVQALGEAAGAACRALGVGLDLAPVVDVAVEGGLLARQQRCLSDDPDRVAVLAEVFLEGLHSWGVGGCVKHFPGLGPVPEDTHETLPELPGGGRPRHEAPFEATAAAAGMVMMAHVRLPDAPDPTLPASLDPGTVGRAAELPGRPAVLADDLDMGALSGIGSLPELAEAALAAGNHGLPICRSWQELPEVADHLRERAGSDPGFRTRLDEATARLLTRARDLRLAFTAEPAPDDETVAQLWERARREAER